MKKRTFEGKPVFFERARLLPSSAETQTRAIKSGDDIRVILSTERAASDGHVIMQSGWDLSRFRGALLYEHNRAGLGGGAAAAPLLPIGRVDDLAVVDGESGPELQGSLRFFDDLDPTTNERIYPLAYQVSEAYRRGFLTDVSVGFVMMESVPRSSLDESDPRFAPFGLVSTRTLLLELSSVIFGADSGARMLEDDDQRTDQDSTEPIPMPPEEPKKSDPSPAEPQPWYPGAGSDSV